MEYFTKIKEPRRLRVALMTAAKDTVVTVAMLEHFTELRAQKTSLIASLRDDFKEMSQLCKTLAELIADEKTRREILAAVDAPKTRAEAPAFAPLAQETVTAPVVEKDKKGKKGKGKGKKAEPESEPEPMPAELPKRSTEVDRLEYTLNQIEQKLSDLQK
jgi:hypothetical protein